MRFRERVVFVTGAASGIGRATAQLFANEGAKVFAAPLQLTSLADDVAALDLLAAMCCAGRILSEE